MGGAFYWRCNSLFGAILWRMGFTIHLSFLHSGKEGEGMMGWLASADASSFSLRMASRNMWAEYVGGVDGDGDGDG